MEQLALLPDVVLNRREPGVLRNGKPDPYPMRCPYCWRIMTRQGGMRVAVKYRSWIAQNIAAVSEAMLKRQASGPAPDLTLSPDLELSLQYEASALGISVSELVGQVLDRYFEGELERLVRRAKKVQIPGVTPTK